RWFAQLGEEETEALLKANNTRPAISLRANPMLTTVEELEAELLNDGLHVARSRFHPGMLRAESFSNIAANRAFREGRFTIQDEGAALAVLLTDARPGQRVIDLCAAPGGKSITMAEMMNGQGEIVSVDKYD